MFQSIFRIILLVNLLAVGALWVCCATTWLVPAEHPRLALAGLLFPVFLLCVLAFIIVWVVLKPKWCFFSIIGLIVCSPYILDYCPFSLSTSVPSGSIKVLSWNCRGFSSCDEDRDITPKMFVNFLKEADADIYCLQEASSGNEDVKAFVEQMKEYGYQHESDNGLVLLSRLPVVRKEAFAYSDSISETPDGNGSVCYWLSDENDTILLINNHLESNQLSQEIKTRYASSLSEHNIDSLEQYGRTMGSIIKTKTTSRGNQATQLAEYIRTHNSQPIICCGDLNDTPISYVYQQLSKVLKNTYRESGTGIGISYNETGFWVRIDHIFVSEHFQSYNTFVDNSQDLSDHYPIITWLKRK